MLGMYIHMHWGYSHPYAARTWSEDDWRSYLTGLRSIGYDFVQIWPMLDSMPPEPTASDLAFLEKLGRVIRMAQGEMGMRVTIVSCPNTIGNARANAYGFEGRPYFECEWRLNPADPASVETFLAGRRKQLAPISHADGIVVIDSDPGGYIGSTNEEFVELTARQTGVMRELNPKAELVYWMHFGWENYNRFWETTSKWQPGDPPFDFTPDPQVFRDTLALVKERIAEPWSVLANNTPWGHRAATDALGLAHKRCALHYGLIEGEPTFPFTNCNPKAIGDVVREYTHEEYPLGFLGNSQTHVMQLPHTYLVAEHWLRGADAKPDLAAFADQLVRGLGATIGEAWLSLEGPDAGLHDSLAARLSAEVGRPHAAGASSGLLIGSADRFLTDLVMNLRVRARLVELRQAIRASGDVRPALRSYLAELRPYQERLGFVDAAGGPAIDGLFEAAAALNDPATNAVIADYSDWRDPSVRHGLLPKLLDALATGADV